MLRRKRLADLPEHWDFGELTPGAQVRVRRNGYYHLAFTSETVRSSILTARRMSRMLRPCGCAAPAWRNFCAAAAGASHLWPCGAKAAARAG